ncbi:HD domain-containing phosphohydrolase [Halomonas sp. GFAJ-1]|uniref:HD domain-containing phosphohydrolase n=1 Tax=Halomonas sp. GFAJ-1 TaxID=1118153 RepID=UPI00023A4B4F|nr:HD domain-containing phosphohydrolase [Halomonas sp. GFAJ-1]AVI61203.1 metal-dependent phosphohydrolase [Halomonas sp. GFAJ-1]EHK61868.1 putative metal dependent phosphohydrolase [Halomonas sp. GFAJ-1]
MHTLYQSKNPSAKVLQNLIKHEYELCIYAKNLPCTLAAEVVGLSLDGGQLLLKVETQGDKIEDYLDEECINFDIEALHLYEASDKNRTLRRDAYSISNVPAVATKLNAGIYQLKCTLPASVFLVEHRGTARIPFILGMSARVSIEIYTNGLVVNGSLRNISVGGCLVEISIEDSNALTVGHLLPGVTIEFPNGTNFRAKALLRHIRPFGHHGYAALGIQFEGLDPQQTEEIFHLVSEVEREAAYRSGINEKIVSHSYLFLPGTKQKTILRREEQSLEKRKRQSPIQRGVLELAHQLQYALMYIKSREHFPEKTLYDCVETVLYFVRQDRKTALYSLSFLHNEPGWVRHAIRVATQTADMMLLRDAYSISIREVVLGALLHTMGKPLMVSEELPSLKESMNARQKLLLKQHVNVLIEKLTALKWVPSEICEDVILNANERLDGTGYPRGLKDEQLTEVVKLVSIIKAVDKLTHVRNGIQPRTPLDAYRIVNEQHGSYDKAILVEYIQCYGLYPIGSLAKFSGGFLAWIMDVDNKGMPVKVDVVKNLAFRDTNIDTILDVNDFGQIGRLEGIVDPDDYGIQFAKM